MNLLSAFPPQPQGNDILISLFSGKSVTSTHLYLQAELRQHRAHTEKLQFLMQFGVSPAETQTLLISAKAFQPVRHLPGAGGILDPSGKKQGQTTQQMMSPWKLH